MICNKPISLHEQYFDQSKSRLRTNISSKEILLTSAGTVSQVSEPRNYFQRRMLAARPASNYFVSLLKNICGQNGSAKNYEMQEWIFLSINPVIWSRKWYINMDYVLRYAFFLTAAGKKWQGERFIICTFTVIKHFINPFFAQHISCLMYLYKFSIAVITFFHKNF